MASKPRIVFLVGGAYHPTLEQAEAVAGWLGDGADCVFQDGRAAFAALDEADLFVPMGTHFTGMMAPALGSLPYYPPTAVQRDAFEQYIASGRPVLVHHGSILSFDDWPRFGELIGFRWGWTRTKITQVHRMLVQIEPTGHPITEGLDHFTIEDELYVDMEVMPGLNPQVHAGVHIQDEQQVQGNGHTSRRTLPLVFTVEGGRVSGAGKVVYLVNGHDMRAFECPALRQLWLNAVRWLTL